MVKIFGTYQLVQTVNVEEYIKFLGLKINEDAASTFTKTDWTLKIYIQGRVYKVTTTNGPENRLTTFTLGKSFEETFPDGSKFTTTVTKEGNRLFFMSRGTDTTTERIYDFSADGVIMKVQGTDIELIYQRIEKQRDMFLR